MNKLVRMAAVSAALMAVSSGINAANSTFVDLHSNGGGGVANSINNANQIAGDDLELVPTGFGGFNVEHRAAVWEGSVMTRAPLTYDNNEYSYGQLINDSGQILITAQLHGYSGFVWDVNNNTINNLDDVSPINYHANYINNEGKIFGDINGKPAVWDNPTSAPKLTGQDDYAGSPTNNLGQMTGSSIFDSSPHRHATIKDGDTLIDLGTLGGDTSYGYKITDTGYVIGSSQLTNGTHASFLWDGDSMEKLQYLQGLNSITPMEINNLGQSVGFGRSLANDYTHAMLWDGTRAYDLNNFIPQELADAGWVLKSANDINDHGWIVGEMYNTDTRQQHAFKISTADVISSVPEPTTWAMLLAGLGLLGVKSMRNRSRS